MKPERNDKLINMLAFFAIALIALLIIIGDLFPRMGVNISGPVINVLATMKNLFVLLVLGLAGYEFVRNKSKGWKWTYWICVVIFIVATILIWVKW